MSDAVAGHWVDVGLLSPVTMPEGSYESLCGAWGLPAPREGYGVALALMADGSRWTCVTPLTAGGATVRAAGWVPITDLSWRRGSQ